MEPETEIRRKEELVHDRNPLRFSNAADGLLFTMRARGRQTLIGYIRRMATAKEKAARGCDRVWYQVMLATGISLAIFGMPPGFEGLYWFASWALIGVSLALLLGVFGYLLITMMLDLPPSRGPVEPVIASLPVYRWVASNRS